jgi:GT2 family glycosyltransferase
MDRDSEPMIKAAAATPALARSGQGHGALASADVAVVIVNYNSGPHLRMCLQALGRQTRSPRRVIVVDNASTDDSLTGASASYANVEILHAGRNLGFAGGNNLAIRSLDNCRYVALVNADAYVEPDWLERLLDAAMLRPDCDFFSCRLLSATDPTRLDGTGDVYHVSGRAWRRDWGQPATASSSSTPTLGACAAAALYKREALIAIDCFDEDYFCFYEDVDLSFRLQLTGHRGLYVAEAIARHVGSASTVRQSDFCVYYGHRNLVWTYVKNMPGPLFWLYLPQHLALNLATVFWFALQGRGRLILRAKWDALRGLRGAWSKRRSIQARRTASIASIRLLLARGLLTPYFGP